MAYFDTLVSLGTQSMSIFTVIILILSVVALFGVFYWIYLRNKRFKEYTVIVWYRDGFGQLSQVHDQAGIFLDKKTNNKRFFMKRANVGLSPDNIPFVMSSDNKRFVYVYRNGLKNFHFLKPNVTTEGVTIKVGEEDVNWGINAYMQAKNTFQFSSLMQYLPFISLVIVSIIILILFIYFFKQFGSLKETGQLLKEMSVNLKDTALVLAKNQTVVIPS